MMDTRRNPDGTLTVGIIEDAVEEKKVEKTPAPKAEQPEAPKKPRATTRRKK